MDLCRERPSAFFPLWFSQMPTFSHTLFLFCRPASGLPERGCTKLRWMPPKISKEVVESLQPVSAVSGTAALSEYSQIRPNMTFFFFFFSRKCLFLFFSFLTSRNNRIPISSSHEIYSSDRQQSKWEQRVSFCPLCHFLLRCQGKGDTSIFWKQQHPRLEEGGKNVE